MSPKIIVKPDGTTEIIYNDNKIVKIPPNVDIMAYKCPHFNCPSVFFSKDDLNSHLIKEHAEIPKDIINLSKEKPKYFSKSAMYRMNGTLQREELKHVLLTLNVYSGSIGRAILNPIKRRVNVRNDRV